MAVRVGALMALKVFFTPAALELCRPGGPAEKIFLSPEFLNKARTLSQTSIAELTGQGAGDRAKLDAALTVLETEDGRIIALEEEAFAADAWHKVKEREARKTVLSPSLPARIQEQAALPDVIAEKEALNIFTADEVARLKLAVLTSVDPSQRIEALRRLVYAPQPPDEKAAIFMKALSDDNSEVRKEAVLALGSLGLNKELCDAMRLLSTENEKQREVGLQKLVRLSSTASPLERAIVLAVVLASVRTEKSGHLLEKLVQSIGSFASVFSESPEFLSSLTRLLIDLLVTNFDAISPSIRLLYAQLGHTLSDKLGVLLLTEIGRVEDKRLRAFLLVLASSLPKLDGEVRKKVMCEMAANLADWSEANLECRRLATALKGFGQSAVATIMDTFPNVHESQMPLFIRLLDSICMDEKMEPDALSQVGAFLVEALKTARKPTRLAIMESRVYANTGLPSEQRAAIAWDFIRNAHDYRLEQIVEMTKIALVRIGPPAVEPLFKALRETPYDLEKEIAMSSLADIIVAARDTSPKFVDTVEKVVKFCVGLVEDATESTKTLLPYVGRICAGSAVQTPILVQALKTFRSSFKRDAANLEILVTLSELAAAPSLPASQLMELGMFFVELFKAKLPAIFSRETQTPDGTLLEIGGGTEAYSTFVPTLIRGLRNASLAPACTDIFREKLVTELLAKWEDVTEYRVVLGPRNTIVLAEALGAVACSPHCVSHLRIAIAKALRKRIVHMPIIEILGKVFGQPDESRGLTDLCAEVSKELVEMLSLQDYQEVEDRETLLRALARVAKRATISLERKENEGRRRHIVDLLFQGLEDNIFVAKDLLRELESCENLPKSLRKNIKERLARR
jgi:hypothetical protein